MQVFGTEVNGAKSWLYVGPLPGFQPSEMTKLAILVALAAALHDRPIKRWLDYLRPALLVAVPTALVLVEPDLGGALVLLAIGGGMVLVRGVPVRHVLRSGWCWRSRSRPWSSRTCASTSARASSAS